MELSRKIWHLFMKRYSRKSRSWIFGLPEKILQFGTGVLLRALPDYFIDKANRQGIFNGRVVVIKSTGTGEKDAFERQDGMYTSAVRGLENGDGTGSGGHLFSDQPGSVGDTINGMIFCIRPEMPIYRS